MKRELEIKKVVAYREGASLIIRNCPFCGQTHHHSGNYGHRLAHCVTNKPENGYILIEPINQEQK